jgi:8-oxo-dGTP pyrophosphatase MutT (NUDIX family)
MSLFTYSGKPPSTWYASGVIIFNYDLTKTIIVKTPKGNVGFPKGGREDNEKLHQTAYREVMEETGLMNYQYRHDKTIVGEKKGNNPKVKCTIYYFIARINNPDIEDLPLKCCNPGELSFVEWTTIEDACKILCKRRRDILEAAHKYITNLQTSIQSDIVKIHKLIDENKTKSAITQSTENT